MLENINQSKKYDSDMYDEYMENMEARFKELQLEMNELDIPVVILVDGWGVSGKGNLISKIVEPLDPRFFKVHTINKTNDDIKMRPYLWSFASKMPSKGNMTIFDMSWCRIGLNMDKSKWDLSKQELDAFYKDINNFEKHLVDDGVVIIKIFMHISKKELDERIDKLKKDPLQNWRVNENDEKQSQHYRRYIEDFENMIIETNTLYAPWHVVPADKNKNSTYKSYEAIIKCIQDAIANKQIEKNIKSTKTETINVDILNNIDLSEDISNKEYKEKLKVLQNKISDLGKRMYKQRKSAIVLYEGWDASGKGGNIKRLTQKLDPRGYEVVPISAPTKEELSHHYMWRFWTRLPKDGHITIYDRSWYGRVMVERIEGFCKDYEWQRAYNEINEIEEIWSNHGIIIYKFFLHIDKDEQLARFEARQNDPTKQYKITDEDWRNRDKWDEYETAIDDMLFKTNTDHAPWNIIPSNSKKVARIKVLEFIAKDLERRLDEDLK